MSDPLFHTLQTARPQSTLSPRLCGGRGQGEGGLVQPRAESPSPCPLPRKAGGEGEERRNVRAIGESGLSRRHFLWQAGGLGGGAPAWLLPRDRRAEERATPPLTPAATT